MDLKEDSIKAYETQFVIPEKNRRVVEFVREMNGYMGSRIGTRYARRLRDAGRIPAVIYGHGAEPVHVAADAKEAYAALKEGAHLINASIDGTPEPCLVKDIQFDYLGDTVIHLDLARVDLTQEVEVEVDLVYKGEPEGINSPGVLVQHPHPQIAVKCKANAIPDEIIVDISGLTSDAPLLAGDLPLPEGVALASEPQMAVAAMTVVQETSDEAAEAADGEPEVIEKGKGEEEAADG
ncbi:MAG: 50S ribosomal protein L25, partial [Planctomycetota bacterium]